MYSSVIILVFAALASAKTDFGGCSSSQTTDQYGSASVLWYVPSSGEICKPLDCGGGRAPPKTTVAGCAAYEGTATYSPSFLAGFNAQETGASTASIPSSTMTITSAVTTSTAVATESSIFTTSGAVMSSSSEEVYTIQTSTSIAPSISITSTGILVASSPGSTLASMPPVAVANGTATTSSPATTSSLVVNNAGASVSIQGMSGLMGFAAAGFAFFL